MNHSFAASQTDTSKCAVCKFTILDHTDMATCDCCSNIGPVEVRYGNCKMCEECRNRDDEATAHSANSVVQKQRVDAMNVAIEAAKKIDQSAKIRTDLFNASTVAIEEMRLAIVEDSAIINKPYALAEALTTRFEHFTNLIFELNQKQIEYHSEQKAIQTYLNNLANQLRKEEREKLKISDINYQPKPVKPLVDKSARVSKPRKSKLDKAELRKYALELGISEFSLQMVCVSQGITPEMAANKMRKSIAEAKSEVN